MNNLQYNTKESYQVTEHWELWETQVNRLKTYLSEIANNEFTFKQEVWHEKSNKKLK